ncbi:hypothetical protein K437DRAFT_293867 [Tilletiaria anomala UBC 951]|uniref:FAD/NAD(P)-binding domain-containing protein n=1 Tax=Tilletiaria anomala (strain ATCC 24038 / CBS 436.72 / UBC 951) TaxID=1037660 RepID=A0A066W467_TILAU|nr:uncharacterized protein K437DRAFT_293867 [Tilletiaria anomala UBC 951]KDN48536.1 hypothetical protein K437DRAFT_293867 [Tilletiaria anomala UBC 951]
MKACIVGTGASGLITGRTLLAFSHDVTVIKRNSEVGGAWIKGLRYLGVTLQAMVCGKEVNVGYSKSACDVAKAWHVLGKALLEYITLPSPFKYLLHRTPMRVIRNALVESFRTAINFQFCLSRLGLHPNKRFATIARASISFATEGFYECACKGTIRDTQYVTIQELRASTSERQRSALLSDDNTFPVVVPGLAFNGYKSSLFCTIASEVAALWVFEYIHSDDAGAAAGTQDADQAQDTFHRLDEHSKDKHAKVTNFVPFSMHAVNELLSDLRLYISMDSRGLLEPLLRRTEGKTLDAAERHWDKTMV